MRVGGITSVNMFGASSVYSAHRVDPIKVARLNALSKGEPVPEVYSNEDTERVEKPVKTAEQLQLEREIAYEQMKAESARDAENPNGKAVVEEEKEVDDGHCETCEKRKYVDGSNENDVSFKTPGHIDPAVAASVVSAHEHMHVANAVQEGSKEGAELLYATVQLKTSVCPECGRTYVSGGVTRTAIRHTNPEREVPAEDSKAASKTEEKED